MQTDTDKGAAAPALPEDDLLVRELRQASGVYAEHREDATADLLSEAATALEGLARTRDALRARVEELEGALREARRRLEKGRPLWNGPVHEAAAVIDGALPETGEVE